MQDLSKLSEHFTNYFSVTLAHSSELFRRVCQIRYRVYCHEFHYEQEDSCPDGLEQDEYDQYSVHGLILHKATNKNAGCVRLIKTPSDDPRFQLPFQRFCGYSLTHDAWHPSKLSSVTAAEVSRLAVDTAFRRRRGEFESPTGQLIAMNSSDLEQRTFPLLSIALMAIATALMSLTCRQHLFVMVEPRLAARMQSLGLPFVQVGTLIDYHGLRAAHHVTTEQMLKNMHKELRELYDFTYNVLRDDSRRAGLNLAEWTVGRNRV